MKITTLEVAGLSPALHGMRNPMDSWEKSDSPRTFGAKPGEFSVGPADRDLSLRLQKAGPEHCKHLRMVMVWTDIEAPLYWWKEMDTYRAGVEKLSCSTMHTITKKPFTADMFSNRVSMETVSRMEDLRKAYIGSDDPEIRKDMWRFIIENLPSGFMQKRTVMMSYAALRNICRQREGHKLTEWREFIEWVKTLPESWMITE